MSYQALSGQACTLTDSELVHRYCAGVSSAVPKLALTIGPEAAENYRRRSIEHAQRYVHNQRLSEARLTQSLPGQMEGEPEGSPTEQGAR